MPEIKIFTVKYENVLEFSQIFASINFSFKYPKFGSFCIYEQFMQSEFHRNTKCLYVNICLNIFRS